MDTKSNYRAWDIRLDDFSRCTSGSERMLFLVRFAVLAPSSHNSQPWYFVVKDSEILLKADLSRALPVSDATNHHLYFALGCALENILIAADYYGLAPHVDYFPDDDTVARIHCAGQGSPSPKDAQEHLVSFIAKRFMNRTRYETRMPDPRFFSFVHGMSSREVQFDLIVEQRRKDAIADALLDFRYTTFDNASFRAELALYKRNNFTRSFLGIPGFTMGFNAPLSLIAPWLIREVNVMKFIRKEDEQTLKEHTPLFVVVSAAQNNKEHWLRSGQMAQRMMLGAERYGLAVAISAIPHNSERFREVAGSSLYPQVFFRVGYTHRAPGHAPRLSAEQVSTVISA